MPNLSASEQRRCDIINVRALLFLQRLVHKERKGHFLLSFSSFPAQSESDGLPSSNLYETVHPALYITSRGSLTVKDESVLDKNVLFLEKPLGVGVISIDP